MNEEKRRFLLYRPPTSAYEGVIHLSVDGKQESCTRRPARGIRESGGLVGDPKAEDLRALRIAEGFRLCRICFKIRPRPAKRSTLHPVTKLWEPGRDWRSRRG